MEENVVRLTVDADEIREKTMVVRLNGGESKITVRFRRLSWYRARRMVFGATAKAKQSDSDGRTAMEIFQDDAMLASIVSVNGQKFDAQFLMTMEAEVGNALQGLILGEVPSPGESVPPSGAAPQG